MNTTSYANFHQRQSLVAVSAPDAVLLKINYGKRSRLSRINLEQLSNFSSRNIPLKHRKVQLRNELKN
jgi:hypothetical protein